MNQARKLGGDLRERLISRPYRVIEDPDTSSYKRAGVLIPLLEEGGEVKVLLTQRTRKVEHHKGQISFPGGTMERRDGSVQETALREAQEEIGLMREDVEILGRIDEARTLTSNYIVHPFVGLVPWPYDFRLNPDEVELLISVPLQVFHPRDLRYRRPSVEYEGVTYTTAAFEYEKHVIWGATARIMENFMDILADNLPLPGATE